MKPGSPLISCLSISWSDLIEFAEFEMVKYSAFTFLFIMQRVWLLVGYRWWPCHVHVIYGSLRKAQTPVIGCHMSRVIEWGRFGHYTEQTRKIMHIQNVVCDCIERIRWKETNPSIHRIQRLVGLSVEDISLTLITRCSRSIIWCMKDSGVSMVVANNMAPILTPVIPFIIMD